MFSFIGVLFYRRNLLDASDTVHIDTRMETLLSQRHNQCSFCWLYVLCSFRNTLDEGMLLEVLMSFAKLQGWFSAVTVGFFSQCNVLRSVISIWFKIRVFLLFYGKFGLNVVLHSVSNSLKNSIFDRIFHLYFL